MVTEVPANAPRWLVIYRRMQELAPGDVLEIGDVRQAIGDNYRGPFGRARQEFLHADHRALVSVRTVGWRVAAANEHASLAVGFKQRALSTTMRGVATVENVRRDELTAQEASRNDYIVDAMKRVVVAIGRKLDEHDERLARIERQLSLPGSSDLPLGLPRPAGAAEQ